MTIGAPRPDGCWGWTSRERLRHRPLGCHGPPCMVVVPARHPVDPPTLPALPRPREGLAMTRAEDALAAVMSETDGAEPGDGMPVTFYIPWATAIIAALPPAIAICSVEEVAERLRTFVVKDRLGPDTQEWEVELAPAQQAGWIIEARRLLGLDEP